MKKYLLIISMVFVCILLKAQINLEHTYCQNDSQYISLVNLGDSIYNYLFFDYSKYPHRYTLYHMNHSVNISDTFPVRGSSTWSVALSFFTRSLFDCDTNNIEFILECFVPNVFSPSSYMSVYRTNGTILFHRDSAGLFTSSREDNSSQGIVKTPYGTKMFVTSLNNYKVEIYSLCGTLPTGMSISKPDDYNGLSSPVPNPALNYTRIDYKLPEDVGSGELVFYDTRGVEVKRFKVDHNFANLQLNTSDLKAGTYYYNLQIPGKTTEGKKLVVIR